MQLAALDWAIVALYVVLALAAGVYFSRRAGRDVDEFFLSGRKLPWWIAGTSRKSAWVISSETSVRRRQVRPSRFAETSPSTGSGQTADQGRSSQTDASRAASSEFAQSNQRLAHTG